MIETVGQLVKALQQFDEDTPVRAHHTGSDTFAPSVYDVIRVYERTDGNAGRGILEENVRLVKDGEFTDLVALVEVGW